MDDKPVMLGAVALGLLLLVACTAALPARCVADYPGYSTEETIQ